MDSVLRAKQNAEQLLASIKNGTFATVANKRQQDKENIDEKRKVKKPKLDTTELPAETLFPEKYVGGHVSTKGGLYNAVINARKIGASAFALFLKCQRRWNSPDLTAENIKLFKQTCLDNRYTNNMVLVHGSYLINLANPDESKRLKSYDAFVDDLKRCQMLGLKLYNFHPGSTVGDCSVDEGIINIASEINKALKEVDDVVCILEAMAGTKNSCASTFEHLAGIIKHVEQKERVGVCIDTCHIFSAGYDIRTKETYEATMEQFCNIIGLKYLKGIHLNDSKGELGCNKDRHEKLGKGQIGIETFRFIINDPRFSNIPMILETPCTEAESYKDEIELLHSLLN